MAFERDYSACQVGPRRGEGRQEGSQYEIIASTWSFMCVISSYPFHNPRQDQHSDFTDEETDLRDKVDFLMSHSLQTGPV